MNVLNLIDGTSAAIVLGGTIVATALRCGTRECAIALYEMGQLWAHPFDSGTARAGLAVQVQAIKRDGILRAQPRQTGDTEFDEATDAMIARRSIPALIAAHERHKARRARLSNTAARLFAQAAELAPVFGMVGTLISLNRMADGGIGGGDFTIAIGMAVLTTLYGLLAANLLFAPISRMIERAAAAEEAERQKVVDWLASQLAESLPTIGPAERKPREAA
ncbi:MAG: MotA/TolQ/ExbB proton channel family protein [Novosphingobium sp.]